jgi:tetratricopeptide (TPR) repeat protein
MRDVHKQISALLAILLALCNFVPAQDKPPSSQSVSQSNELQDLKSALALEDANARIASLQQYLSAWPNSEQADAAREALVQSFAAIAEKQLATQEIDRALNSLRQALASLPATISNSFFEATLIRIPLAVAVRGYRTEAIVFAREIESRCTDSATRLGALGEFYISLEAAEDAVRALESAAKISPNDARTQRTLGAAYRMALRLKESMAAYRQVISLDPADRRAYYELGNLHRAQGGYQEAIRLYQKQLELDPAHTASIKGLALAYLAQGKTESANVELERIRSLKGSDEEIRQDYFFQTQLAFYYLMHGQPAQARQSAEQALTAEPRFSWGRIAAAEVDLAEERYFEAERHLLAARQYSNFPTLEFTLGKLYLTVEDFDGSIAQFSKAFSYSATDGFKTRLGGVLDVKRERLEDLLAPEQQAAIFLFEPPTTYNQFRVIESLMRLDAVLQSEKAGHESGRTNNDSVNSADSSGIENAAEEFVEADTLRKPFRALYAAQRLAQSGSATEVAVKLADQALENAEAATKPEGSLRDYPNYDRDGRLSLFRGRAADAKGWALLKAGRVAEAVAALNTAVENYGSLPEGAKARWHLAAARESAGELREALDLYIAAYERPGANESDVRRAVIESLYRKIHGSLDGLNERIGKPSSTTKKSDASSLTAQRQVKNTGTASEARAKEAQAVETPAINELKLKENADKTSAADQVVNQQSPNALPEPLRGKEPKFSLVLPEFSAHSADTKAQKTFQIQNESLNEPAEVVSSASLPVVKSADAGLLTPLTLSAESLRLPASDHEMNDAEIPIPSSCAVPPVATRPRQIISGNNSVSIRPRRVSSAAADQSVSEIPGSSRRRRVTEPANPRPE